MASIILAPLLVVLLALLSVGGVAGAAIPGGRLAGGWLVRKSGSIMLLAVLLLLVFPRTPVSALELFVLGGWAVLAAGVLLDGPVARILGGIGGALLGAAGLWGLLAGGPSRDGLLALAVAGLSALVFGGALWIERRKARA